MSTTEKRPDTHSTAVFDSPEALCRQPFVTTAELRAVLPWGRTKFYAEIGSEPSCGGDDAPQSGQRRSKPSDEPTTSQRADGTVAIVATITTRRAKS
jgi:hypothetical protein